jgi:dihydrofolate synthase/folylpolyglutamate synthase
VNLVEALAWLDRRIDHETAASSGVSAGRIEGLSLEPMRQLMGLLGDPQLDVPVVHITGTNGKGSVAAMVSALLREHGLVVGTYTSPHLAHVNERIRRDGQPISDEDLAEVLSGVAAVEDLLEVRPSWFEVLTAAAYRWFAEAPVEVAVVEVGLLGRYDATNVADATVAVVTSVGGDHTDFAPGWELAVASEKAGIIGPRSTAVLGEVAPELVGTFQAEGPERLVRLGADFSVEQDQVAVGGHLVTLQGLHSRHEDLFLPVHGAHQVDNAAVALAATEAFFQREVPAEVAESAFASLELPGRFEVVHHAPLVVLDGAHNADALRAMATTLDAEFTPVGSRTVVLGILGGRDADAAVAALAELRPDLVVCTAPDGPRSLDPAVLAAACERAGLASERIADPAAAVARVLNVAAEEDVVVVAGSFRLIEPARRVVARWES